MRAGKRKRFEKKAISKAEKILKLMGSLGDGSNHKKHVYEEEDIRKIIGALEGELEELKRKLDYKESVKRE